MAREELEQGQVEALINELEQKMSRLRALYEQYFMGIERVPPKTARKDVVRLLRRLENVAVRNTAMKFKIRSLVQRFNSYKSYWNRVERQIEEGTYKRDVRRAERNEKRQERADRRREDVVELDVELEDVSLEDLQAELEELDQAGAFEGLDTEKPRPQASAEDRERIKQQRLAEISAQLGIGGDGEQTSPPQQQSSDEQPSRRSAKPKRPATDRSRRREKLSDIKRRLEKRTGKKIGSGDGEAQRVYRQLLEAKRRCNEPTSGLSYESVAKSMKKQREKLQRSRGASNVEFKVVIKDGRAFLKPETD